MTAPNHVAILGLGPSLAQYMAIARGLGGRSAYSDEVWAINNLGDVFQCDRIFHMDDVRIQQIRADAAPDSNIANMLKWMRKATIPIYTSRAHPDYPALVEFPLEDVINNLGFAYLNNTSAYAVAYAIHIGVKKISLYGCDFTYPNAHDAEKGRACVEFWLGFARARGIQVATPNTSSLIDACVPWKEKLYGYDTVDVKITARQGAEGYAVSFTERTSLPTADEIEDRYDHSAHPNPLVERPVMASGERQVSPDLSGIRRDHVARYEWAARQLKPGMTVIDAACGVGYGSKILADAGCKVIAYDKDESALAYAREHYGHESIEYRCADFADVQGFPAADAAVCFETIEHIEDPLTLMRALRGATPFLLASVPNEEVFPFKGYKFHFRHYTRSEFEALLRSAGFDVGGWFGQEHSDSEVEPDVNGRTVAVVARSKPAVAKEAA